MPDDYDPLTDVRADRFRALVAELMPKIRRVSPELSDAQVVAAAELMARYRLADETLGKNAL
ncbi:MAG: hypothetical protein HOQ17_17485 [Gemmatimonadaceae bacterium]|nr:hypothetical protein [Gemmatimonadaceae bacterium]NUO92922.1 hypothetical protein [Gemmatimonadaceae bacterium]NUR33184.1 hypothetical protein [Gemmatimonadaceae bacterium]NUS34838.1 hypothetical protein [Gemmatimonadaceae bacterium]